MNFTYGSNATKKIELLRQEQIRKKVKLKK